MMHLIRENGETMLVNSLEGYPDAEVIESNVPDPPCDTHWCRRVKGQWIVEQDAKSEAEENARLAALTPVRMIAEIATMAQASKPNS